MYINEIMPLIHSFFSLLSKNLPLTSHTRNASCFVTFWFLWLLYFIMVCLISVVIVPKHTYYVSTIFRSNQPKWLNLMLSAHAEWIITFFYKEFLIYHEFFQAEVCAFTGRKNRVLWWWYFRCSKQLTTCKKNSNKKYVFLVSFATWTYTISYILVTDN